MFQRRTVFILGAGASWHYGYPTGEDLVDMVIDKAREIERFVDKLDHYDTDNCWPLYLQEKYPQQTFDFLVTQRDSRFNAWQNVKEECHKLAKHLRYVRPIVIDNFLGMNPSLAPIGKLLIAWVILECEAQYYTPQLMKTLSSIREAQIWVEDYEQEPRYNINRLRIKRNSPSKTEQKEAKNVDITKYKDDWCRFIIHRLAQRPEKLLDNKVTFITFNYDVSLERSIHSGLSSIEAFEKADIDAFMSPDRFLHMYGGLHTNFADKQITLEKILKPNINQPYLYQALFDTAYECSKGIFTIEECGSNNGDKDECEEVKSKANQAINNADDTYILGYGFDTRNNNRLKLHEYLKRNTMNSGEKRVYFTNFQDRNAINKKASYQFLGRADKFLPPAYIQSSAQDAKLLTSYYEKSIKNVYEALEMDFDFL